jgi:hypothetical protein
MLSVHCRSILRPADQIFASDANTAGLFHDGANGARMLPEWIGTTDVT